MMEMTILINDMTDEGAKVVLNDIEALVMTYAKMGLIRRNIKIKKEGVK